MKIFKDNIKTIKFSSKKSGGLFPKKKIDYSNKKYMKLTARNKKRINNLKFVDNFNIIILKIIFYFYFLI